MRNPIARTSPIHYDTVVVTEWRGAWEFFSAFFHKPMRPLRWFALKVFFICFISSIVAYFTYGRWHVPLRRMKEAEK